MSESPSAAASKGLDNQLGSLRQMIAFSNPIHQGHKTDWKSVAQLTIFNEEKSPCQSSLCPSLSVADDEEIQSQNEAENGPSSITSTSGRNLQNKKGASSSFSNLNANHLNANHLNANHLNANTNKSLYLNSSVLSLAQKNTRLNRLPRAKQSCMQEIIQHLPVINKDLASCSHMTFGYDEEMKRMNKEKSMDFFRKRDKYSEYVEARARFSKMHSGP